MRLTNLLAGHPALACRDDLYYRHLRSFFWNGTPRHVDEDTLVSRGCCGAAGLQYRIWQAL